MYQPATDCTSKHQPFQTCTSLYQPVPAWTSLTIVSHLYKLVPAPGSMQQLTTMSIIWNIATLHFLYQPEPADTGLYQRVSTCVSLYEHVSACTNLCQPVPTWVSIYLPVCTHLYQPGSGMCKPVSICTSQTSMFQIITASNSMSR